MIRGAESRWLRLAALALLLTCTAAGVVVFSVRYFSRPKPVEILIAGDESGSGIEVYLGGAVEREGIYSVTPDATLQEILDRGGVLSGQDPLRINLKVTDQDDEITESFEAESGKVNINTATLADLNALPGIGPAKAQAIIDYRNENGVFRSVDDLLNVNGIGPGILENIRDLVTVVG